MLCSVVENTSNFCIKSEIFSWLIYKLWIWLILCFNALPEATSLPQDWTSVCFLGLAAPQNIFLNKNYYNSKVFNLIKILMGFWTLLDTFDPFGQFGRFWTLLDAFWQFGRFWTLLDTFGHFWTLLDTLDAFGHFWTLLALLDAFGCPWTLWTLLGTLDDFRLF